MRLTTTKLGAVQRLGRFQLKEAVPDSHREQLDELLDSCPGETLGQIRQELVELTDRSMKRSQRVTLAGLVTAAVGGVAALSGYPGAGMALIGTGLLGSGFGVASTLNAVQHNTDSLGLLLATANLALPLANH